ncbi:hypothetical protein Tco_0914102, partial [Tanacetum coccineum]
AWTRRHKSFVTASGGPREGVRIFGDHVRVGDSEEAFRRFAADKNIRELSDEEAWEAIENFAQGQKEWDNVEMPRYIAWDNVDNPSPQRTLQILPLFAEYASPLTYPEEIEETLRTLVEVEPLDHMKLKDLGLNTYSHDLFLSSREVPSFDEPEPQPNPLPSCPSLDISLGDERGPEPHNPSSFKMKEMDYSNIVMEEYVQYETKRALRNVYDDALTFESDFSSEPTVSS